MDLVVKVSPFPLEPSINAVCVESIIGYTLNSVPGHDDGDLVLGSTTPQEPGAEYAAKASVDS